MSKVLINVLKKTAYSPNGWNFTSTIAPDGAVETLTASNSLNLESIESFCCWKVDKKVMAPKQ
jgi:hypothetical protein